VVSEAGKSGQFEPNARLLLILGKAFKAEL
jgi:hypothetical protein